MPEHKSPLAEAARMGLWTAGAGFFVSTIQNALSQHSRGAMGVLTRSGGTITFFALMGATYAFTEQLSSNIRQKNDGWNGAAGGCAAGLAAGARALSLPYGLGACAVLGGVMGAFDAAGASLGGRQEGLSFESVEERRKRFFKQKPPQPLQASHLPQE